MVRRGLGCGSFVGMCLASLEPLLVPYTFMNLLEPLTFRPGALDRSMPLSLLLARHKAVRLKRLAVSTTPTRF